MDWNAVGHHLTFMRLYIKALAELGVPVTALSGAPESLDDLRREDIRPGTDVGIIKRTRLHRPFPQPLRSWLNRLLLRADFRRGLRSCATLHRAPAALLFFNCIYHQEAKALDRLTRDSGLPRSGVFLDNPPGSGSTVTRMLAHPSFKAYATMSESHAAADTGLPARAVLFPEMTDTTFSENHPATEELRRFAAGRPLVLAIGFLQPSKGIVALARAALRPESKGTAFAFVGTITWSLFSQEEAAILKKARENTGNCYFKEGRVADGADYNAHIRAADVIFAVYRGFPNSSNTLTKAAVFEKPVIVNDGYLTAERTRRFRLGEIVPQDDADAILRAIVQITNKASPWRASVSPRWDEYRRLHSFDMLKASFTRLLDAYELSAPNAPRPPPSLS